ncbi:hypothetical protein AOL_s00215g791 [Orbilia oligospora ATCC 24927]|uniref:B30.2/SPRY domain-containing protein n=1 Tax=Arthrobotrys oligospora (strain ATCC 24927 / CBS 115.81 / DSM 1491) TaxID=756982 RepID=G1XUY3_ARTOA|nr:hypothetical protein AOL_s00215g791 [Orbilia oligospora ATCC 24927]EGX43005.1 hypothetical protein AOL_s00215g791 [Orbilia oligospora ATCC 24927]
MDSTIPTDSACWKEGKEIFLKSLQESSKPPTKLTIDNFLKDNWDLSRTIANCESLQAKADGEYNKKKGGRFVRKLLDGLMMVKSIADPFLEFAPETVSIAWCAISGLITIAATDVENCGVISDACNSIVSIILTCRIYESRYNGNLEKIGDREVESKIMQGIPNIISLIFEFSWYIKNHLGESRIKRTFKEAFSPKLKDKVQAIDDEYRKVRGIANDAFQERVMDSVEDIRQGMQRDKEEVQNMLFPALQDISDKLNEIHIVKGTLDILKLRQDLQSRRKLFRPNETHIRIFRSIFDPVANHSEILCQWLFTDKHYLSWEQTPPQMQSMEEPGLQTSEINPNVFYIRGKPGFGKSVAMSCVLQRLTRRLKTPVCYFFFRQGDDATQITLRALESLVAQIIDETWVQSEVELTQLVALFSNIGGHPEQEDEGATVNLAMDCSALVDLLGRAIKILNKPVYIVLDALDECIDHDSQGLVQNILNLVSISKTTKFMFSSRIGMGFEKLLYAPTFSTDEDELDCVASEKTVVMTVTEKRTSEDMELYLRQSLGKIMARRNFGHEKTSPLVLASLESTTRVVSSIKQKANGMFTYAAMVIASLEQPSSLTLAQKLKKLPDGMDALYRGRLESMGAEERKLILLALKWVTWATEKVNVVVIAEHFKNIYGSEPTDANEEFESPAFEDFEEPKQTIQDLIKDPEIAETIYHLKVIGRDFFRIDGETYTIDVVHKSVRDWVENEATKADDREAMLKTITPSFIFDTNGGVKVSLQLPATFTNNGGGTLCFQSKREAYLDFAIYQLHVLSQPNFQKRHMPFEDLLNTSRDDEKQEISHLGSQIKGDIVEATEKSKHQQNAPARPYLEKGIRNQGNFTLNFQKEKREYRYEVHTLINLLNIIGNTSIWSVEDRKGEKWDRFWRKFTEFVQPKNYKRWNIQYNQFQLNRSELDAYRPTLYQSILHIAARSGLLMIVEYLLENKLAGVDDEDGNGSTALAISDINPELWKIFLDHGADISKVDPVSGETIWQKAWGQLVLNCDSGNEPLVKSIEDCCQLLIPKETNVNQPCGFAVGNGSALHIAALSGSWPLFDALMRHPGIDVKLKDLEQNTALHHVFDWVAAGSEGVRNQMVGALIEAGLDPNAENSHSATPLPFAISYQMEGAVRLLLEGGADPKDESIGGYSALHWAAARRMRGQGYTDHEKALRIFEVILLNDPAIDRETPDGTTPLEMAFQTWNWDFVKAIMTEYEKKYGKNLEYLVRRDSYNRNFLHHCTFNLRWGLEIAKELIPLIPKEGLTELGDKSTFLGGKVRDLPGVSSKQRNSGGTPLLDACQEGRADLVALYLKAGADIGAKSTAHLNCLEETVIGWYRAKNKVSGVGDEEGLETSEEKIKRYESCCHLILDSSKEMVQSSSPAILHYLVAKGALGLVKRMMDCGIDYTYADVEGWTVVEWANAFKQQGALDLIAEMAKTRNGGVGIDQSPKQLQNPTKLVSERHQTLQKASDVVLSNSSLTFEVPIEPDTNGDVSGLLDRKRDDVQSVAFDRPVSPTSGVSYFEVTFVEGDAKLICLVGFSGEFFRLDRATGSSMEAGDGSFGLLGLTGGIFTNSKPVNRHTLRSPATGGDLTFGKGDTVGCGLDINQGLIFYTLNGEYAGVAFENVYGRWYGTISCGTACEGQVNMGHKPFMFEEMNEYLANEKV